MGLSMKRDHRPVRAIVMEQRMGELAHHLGDIDTERSRRGGVHERATTVRIDAIDPLTRRLEQHAEAGGEARALHVGGDVVAACLI